MWRRATYTVLLIAYGVYVARHTAFVVQGSDSSGYFNAARLLADGALKIRATPLDALHLDDSWRDLFLPLGFAHVRDARMFAPSYPLGYPLHLLLFALIGGWSVAPFLVTPLCAAVALIAVYKLARELDVPEALAVAIAVILAITPGWMIWAQAVMSDVPATMWCALAVLFAIRSQRNALWAIACGVAFGIAVWMRPTDLLLIPAIGFAMRWRLRPLAAAVAAAAPFGIALMIANHAIWGSAIQTGYGTFEMSAGGCAGHHAWWLGATLTPLVFPLSLAVVFMRRIPMWQRLMLASWFLAFFIFYSCYPICDAWWYLRFLLPAVPALLVSFALVLRDLVTRRAVQFALIAIVVVTGLALDYHYDLPAFHESQSTERDAVLLAKRVLPPNSLVVMMQMSGAYYYYTHQLAARYEFFDADKFEEFRAYLANAGMTPYALIFDWEAPEFHRHVPGRWVEVDRLRDVALLELEN